MRYTIDNNGCWIWSGNIGSDGYGKIAIKGKTFRAHRIMAHLTLKPLMADEDIVAHKCDNRLCINPDHLFITTVMGNVQDRQAKRRGAKGEGCAASKLTETQVIEMRRLYGRGYTLGQLAELFPMTPGGVRAVVKRITWKHIS